MKISKGFCLERHLISSPDLLYESGDFCFLCHSIFGSESVENCWDSESLKLELRTMNGLNDCVCLWEGMKRLGDLPSVFQFNQLLSRVIILAEYSAAIWGFQWMNIL